MRHNLPLLGILCICFAVAAPVIVFGTIKWWEFVFSVMFK